MIDQFIDLSARSPGYVLNVLSETDWQDEYRRSSVKSLYTVAVETLQRGVTFGQYGRKFLFIHRACIAIYKQTGQLLFAITVIFSYEFDGRNSILE